MRIMRSIVKSLVKYQGSRDTGCVREAINAARCSGLPYCPVDEGDVLYFLVKNNPNVDCLEIGFATGSTAAYICEGLSGGNGKLVSIDYAQDSFQRRGVKLIENLGHTGRHVLVEENSVIALPDMVCKGYRFRAVQR